MSQSAGIDGRWGNIWLFDGVRLGGRSRFLWFYVRIAGRGFDLMLEDAWGAPLVQFSAFRLK